MEGDLDERMVRSIERRLERVESTLRLICRRLGMDELTIRREEREIEELEQETTHNYPRTTGIRVSV